MVCHQVAWLFELRMQVIVFLWLGLELALLVVSKIEADIMMVDGGLCGLVGSGDSKVMFSKWLGWAM